MAVYHVHKSHTPIAASPFPSAVDPQAPVAFKPETSECETKRNARPDPPHVDLTLPGRLRADDVQAILRIGRTWLYRGIQSGKYPPPDYVEGRARYWKHSTILKMLQNAGGGAE
jgi:predicted DNA-binding transcriptional regulator AlpA